MKMLHQQRNQSLKLLVIIPTRLFEDGPVYIKQNKYQMRGKNLVNKNDNHIHIL